MAKIPLPERGQPIDLSYVYTMANAINDIAVSTSTNNTGRYTTVDTPLNGAQTVKTSEARVVGGYVKAATGSDVIVGNEISFVYNFPSDFKYAPIVTASPINIGNTTAGRNVVVILKAVTTSKVEGIVRFNTAGNVTLGVNIIAVGIAN